MKKFLQVFIFVCCLFCISGVAYADVVLDVTFDESSWTSTVTVDLPLSRLAKYNGYDEGEFVDYEELLRPQATKRDGEDWVSIPFFLGYTTDYVCNTFELMSRKEDVQATIVGRILEDVHFPSVTLEPWSKPLSTQENIRGVVKIEMPAGKNKMDNPGGKWVLNLHRSPNTQLGFRGKPADTSGMTWDNGSTLSIDLNKYVDSGLSFSLEIARWHLMDLYQPYNAFYDVWLSHWFWEPVYYISKIEYMSGSNGMFRPNDNISVGELATVAIRQVHNHDKNAKQLNTDLSKYTTNVHWSAKSTQWLVDNGFADWLGVKGAVDKATCVKDATRLGAAEALVDTLLYSFPDIHLENERTFTLPSDCSSLTPEGKRIVERAAEFGITDAGLSQDEFRPNDKVTRAEFAKMLYAAFNAYSDWDMILFEQSRN